jgi:hypothetical protein
VNSPDEDTPDMVWYESEANQTVASTDDDAVLSFKQETIDAPDLGGLAVGTGINLG